MKAFVCLLFGLLGLVANGCKVMRVAPDVISAISRTHSVSFDVINGDVERGNFDRAETGLKKLAADHPDSPLLISEVSYIRALIEEKKGDIPSAVAKYRAVMADHPQTPDAYLAAKKLRRL